MSTASSRLLGSLLLAGGSILVVIGLVGALSRGAPGGTTSAVGTPTATPAQVPTPAATSTQSPTATLSPSPAPSPAPSPSPSPALPSPASPSPALPSPTAPSPTAVVPSPSGVPSETVEEFLPPWIAATRAGDQDYLMARLHPAVLEVFGRSTCRQFLRGFVDATFDVQPTEITGPAPWDYAPDGRSVIVPDAYTVVAQFTAGGQTNERHIHFAPIEGQMRWFTDCGDPTP